MVTFFFINVTWVFFRAADFSSAWKLLTSMFSTVPKAEALLTTLSIIKVGVITVLLVAFHWMMRNTRVLTVAEKLPWWLLGIIWSVSLLSSGARKAAVHLFIFSFRIDRMICILSSFVYEMSGID